MNTTEDFDKDVQEAARQVIKISPSKKRVLEMTDELLLKNYALIAHKASSLSSSQRKMVESRLSYAVKAGRIKMEEITGSVNELTRYIQEKLTKAELTNNDDSTTEQGQPI